MVRPLSTYGETLTLFELIHIHVRPAIVTIPLFTWSEAAEGVAQELSLSHLDLALPSPNHVHWKKRARTLFHRNLPYLCREYMLAETVSKSHKLTDSLDQVISHHYSMVCIYSSSLCMLTESWFVPFEKAIFDKIAERNDAQKTLIIRRYLSALERSAVYPHHRFDAIMPTLVEQCTNLDFELTMEVLSKFCDSETHRLRLFEIAPNGECLERLILQARDNRFDFWGLWNGRNNLALNFLQLNQENSKVLLQYAFPYATVQDALLRRCRILNDIWVGGQRLIKSTDVFTQQANAEKRTRTTLILDTFITYGDFYGPADFNDMVNTLVYLTRTLSLPYVTTTELEDTMLEVVIPDFQNDLKEIASKYGNAKVFEDDVDTLKPRRLMHLCRVVIRRTLSDNFLHLDGIEQLKIPEFFKEYLKLER